MTLTLPEVRDATTKLLHIARDNIEFDRLTSTDDPPPNSSDLTPSDLLAAQLERNEGIALMRLGDLAQLAETTWKPATESNGTVSELLLGWLTRSHLCLYSRFGNHTNGIRSLHMPTAVLHNLHAEDAVVVADFQHGNGRRLLDQELTLPAVSQRLVDAARGSVAADRDRNTLLLDAFQVGTWLFMPGWATIGGD